MKSKNKVLLVGLGILGGGLATALWLLKHKAQLTVTDLKSKKDLEPSLKKLKKYSSKIKFVLGKHRQKDFDENDIIVVNPAIPTTNTKLKVTQYLNKAKKQKKIIENEISLFFRFCRNPIIGITGTRGKTTTTNWIGHLLKVKYPQTFIGGNIPDSPVLSFLDKISKNSPVVLELSCFQLELLQKQSPHLAVITNFYQDHLNRYQTMKKYARIKANIFLHQKPDDYLILNDDNSWTKYFLSLKPVSQVYFTSQKKLPKKLNGIFQAGFKVYFQENGKKFFIFDATSFVKTWGKHNLENLLRAILAAELLGLNVKQIKKQIVTLPQVKMRQEIVFQNNQLTIINDSAGTSPEAAVVALNRWDHNKNFILITGGTDKNLDFKLLAKKIKEKLPPGHLICLNGSATKRLIEELEKLHYSKICNVFDNLGECLTYGLFLAKNKEKAIIAFSPAAASFEKFKNEFDRGEKFNKIVKNYLK